MRRLVFPKIFLGLVLCQFTGALRAQNWDPFPTLFPGEQAAVKEDIDGPRFDDLRRCLKDFSSPLGARYYAAVVEVTAASGFSASGLSPGPSTSAVPYADALYQAWRDRGRLEPESHVLIAVSLTNRTLGVHPGSRWADLGFEVAAIRRTIDASRFGDLARGGDFALAICALVSDIDQRLVELDQSARRKAVFLPRLMVLLLVGGLGLFLLLRLRRRRRARQRMNEELARWKDKVEFAAVHLYELEEQHPLYFAAGTRHWSGDSESLDQRCADAVNQLFLLYSKAVDLLDKAGREAAGAKRWSLSTGTYDKVWRLLRSAPIRLEKGEAEERRRIFMPLTREYQGTALSLLDDLDQTYREATSLLTEVADIEARHSDLVEAAKKASSEATLRCSRRGELGLPTEPLMEALGVAEQILHEGDHLLGDPLKAAEVLRRAREEFDRVEARARLGNEVIENLRGPITALGEKLRGEVQRLRETDLRLEEPGFEPDLELDRGVREARRVEQLVAAGEEQEASDHSRSLETSLGVLSEQMQAIERAHGALLSDLGGVETSTREIRARLPEGRGTLEQLNEEYALEAFQEASDNLEELDHLLSNLEQWTDKIRQDCARQHYLSALAAFEDCAELVSDGTAFLDEIAQAKDTLEKIRRQARELAEEDRRLVGLVEPLLDQPGVARELAEQVGGCVVEVRRVLARCSDPRPNWPVLEETLADARNQLDDLRANLEEEINAYARGQKLAQQLARRLTKLERQVAGESRDRPHVGRMVADSVEQLKDWRAQLESSEAGGRELLSVGESLRASIDRAEQVWRNEMELVRSAETELRAALADLRRVRGRHFGYGVMADFGSAQSLLSRAEGLRDRNEWDQVLAEARQARRFIDQEEARGRRRARELEEEARRQAARQRRRRQWEQAIGTAVVVGSQMAGAGAGSRSRLPRRGPSLGPSFGSSFPKHGSGSFAPGGGFGGTRSGGSRW